MPGKRSKPCAEGPLPMESLFRVRSRVHRLQVRLAGSWWWCGWKKKKKENTKGEAEWKEKEKEKQKPPMIYLGRFVVRPQIGTGEDEDGDGSRLTGWLVWEQLRTSSSHEARTTFSDARCLQVSVEDERSSQNNRTVLNKNGSSLSVFVVVARP